MVWRQEKVLRTNLQPNPTFRSTSGYVTVRTNLCSNPVGATSLTGWSMYLPGGAGTQTSVVNATYRNCVRASVSTASTSGGGNFYKTPNGAVVGGSVYTVSAYCRTDKNNITWRPHVVFYTADGTEITNSFTSGADKDSSTAGTWTRVAVTAIAPANAVAISCRFYTSSEVPVGTVLDVTAVLIENTTFVQPYFDGASTTFDLNLESVWSGTVDASTSIARGKNTVDWTTIQPWASWQAEDGKSAYLRFLSPNSTTPAPAGTAPMYTSSVQQAAKYGDTVVASMAVQGPGQAYLTVQGYSNTAGTETSPGSNRETTGFLYTPPYKLNNPATLGIRLIFRVDANSAYPGATYRLSYALLEVSDTIKPYFDGDNINNPNVAYRWNGVANRSSSDMYIPALASPPAGLWDSSTSGYAESWYVDGVDVQSMAFGIETVDSQPPTLKGDHLALSGANGVIPQFNRAYEPGSVALKMWVLGCEVDGTVPGLRSGRRQLFERNLRMLLRLFGYQGNVVTLKKTIYGDSLDSAPITVTARAIVSEVANIDTQMARQRATVSVALTLVDSFWSDAAVTTDTTGASATVPKTLNLTDVGTAPVDDAVIKITGPITSPRVTCPASGSWIQYNGTVSAGQTLTIDSKAGTAFLGTNSVLSNVTHGGTAKFMVIPPRNQGTVTDTGFQTALALSGSSAGTTTSMSVSYYRKHWVIV